MKSILKKVAGLAVTAALALGMMSCEQNVDTHEHTFAIEWTSDATHHWHSATCEHTTEVKDKAAHTFGEWNITLQPTEEAEGSRERECSVCGYKATEAIAKLDHVHTFATTYSSDATHHWHAATCDHTTEVKDKAEHSFGDYVSNNDATTEADGTKTRTCSVCGYEDTVTDEGSKIVATPIFSVESGEVESGTEVTITSTTEGAKIYYTTDESAPTAASTEYTAAISVTEAVTIKAIAVKDGMNDSAVASASYTIKQIPEGFAKVTGTDVGSFYIAKTELTYAEWYEVYQWAVSNGYVFQDLGREGSHGTDGTVPSANSKQPVTMVSWRDAVVWCNAASEKAGLTPVYEYEGNVLKEAENYSDWGTNTSNTTNVDAGDGKAEKATVKADADGYRLPTEAEWEYAAKGGANYTYSGSDNIDDVAWYSGNSENKTHDVGTKDANGYELHDMSGNVWEWCQDTSSSNRVRRGGSWGFDAHLCAVSKRYDSSSPYERYNSFGFRVVRNAN